MIDGMVKKQTTIKLHAKPHVLPCLTILCKDLMEPARDTSFEVLVYRIQFRRFINIPVFVNIKLPLNASRTKHLISVECNIEYIVEEQY